MKKMAIVIGNRVLLLH